MNINENLDGTLKSYWIDSSENTYYPFLTKDIKVDVAIIGGGIVGITSALLLKSEGVKIALLEGYKMVQGTSGYTTAKITSQHDLIYSKLINNMGLDRAMQYAEANEKAITFIEDTIKKYSIDCDFKKLSACIYTEKEEFIDSIEKETEAALKLGLKAEYVKDIPLPLNTKAALYFRNQAQFHPRKYLLSLLHQISKNEDMIFENTRIIDISPGNPITLITDIGNKILASKVIIASHFPCYDGTGLYFTRLKPERSYIVAAKLKEKFPEAMFINCEEPGRSMRSQPFNEGEMVLFGGESHKTAHGENLKKHYENLIEFAKDRFNAEEIKYRWSAQDYTTLDGVPYIGRLTSDKENIYVATGFSKWGMTLGTASAFILKDIIVDGESPYQYVFSPSRANFLSSAKNFIVENTDVAKELIKGKLSPAKEESEPNIGEAKITEIQGKKYGVYKDENGTLYTLDITCTHAGCELKWNDAENSWDCPMPRL